MEGHALSQLTREVFGNVPDFSKALFYALSAAVLGVMAWGVWRRVRRWRLGRPDAAWPDWRTMAGNLWRLVLLQGRIRGHGRAGLAHRLLFGGFVLLFVGTVLVGLEHVAARLLGRGPQEPVFHKGLYYAIYEPVLEAAGLALLAGSVMFAWRRWRRPPEIGHDWRDWVTLALFVAIGVTGFVLEGLRLIREQTPLPWLSFVGAACAEVFAAAGVTRANVGGWHLATWWIHAVFVFGFLAVFPLQRLMHAIAGTVRLAAGVDPLGTLSPVSLEQVEATGELGVSRVEQFRQRQLMELDACVACGRCDLACPALEAGKPLSPRAVVQDIRRHWDGIVDGLGSTRPAAAAAEMALPGGVIAHATLWSCTTCSACVDACPLGVRPLDFITDLRRSLIADGQLRGAPAQALQKTDRAGNPWGLPAQDRLAWAADLRVPTVQDTPDYEVLYWIGCAAAYDRRLQKTARSMVRLLRAAEVKFAVLGNLERCTGEAARRMGDELLFQQLAARNLETFAKFGVRERGRRIVSHCPHCVNSFRQDYAQLGEPLTVVHHTEFLDELLRAGRLKLRQPDGRNDDARAGTITYHDPCYLARVQDVTAAPRALLARAAGHAAVVEMPRHGRQTACCGAGGGRMWFDDPAGQRVGRGRVDEALATQAATLAVACPFCQIMTADGLAARDGRMAVRDIAEILADQLSAEPATTGGPAGNPST